jgi:hypothetical protein
MSYRAKSNGISRSGGRDMPMVAEPLRELPTLAILFLHELPKDYGTFFAALAVSATVPRPSHNKIRQI